MASISNAEVKVLDSVTAPLCVSLYLPIEPGLNNHRANQIRLKNCIKKIKQYVNDGEYDRSHKRDILDRLGQLAEVLSPVLEGDSLAIFVGDKFTRMYGLNEPLEAELYVGTSFDTQPLHGVLTKERPYYVLALGKQQARLFRASKSSIEEIMYDDLLKQSKTKRNMKRQFKQIDSSLSNFFQIDESPVVIVGANYALGAYRAVSRLKRLSQKEVQSNTDRMSKDEIRRTAWPAASRMLSV